MMYQLSIISIVPGIPRVISSLFSHFFPDFPSTILRQTTVNCITHKRGSRRSGPPEGGSNHRQVEKKKYPTLPRCQREKERNRGYRTGVCRPEVTRVESKRAEMTNPPHTIDQPVVLRPSNREPRECQISVHRDHECNQV
ncbi:uncharacterized protein LOC135164421 [Diachasmimorpha longicaudata]|uniref:uncharacterized protein LOC135164421 n=1 Tax=Diachasmimorpha longicaudata TaxID=58733 RepID=UPI0030B886F7